MVLLNPKAKENMEHSHKDFMSERKKDFRKGNEEKQTDKKRSKEVGGYEVQKQRGEVSCSEVKMQSLVSNSSKSQKESCIREATETFIGGKVTVFQKKEG